VANLPQETPEVFHSRHVGLAFWGKLVLVRLQTGANRLPSLRHFRFAELFTILFTGIPRLPAQAPKINSVFAGLGQLGFMLFQAGHDLAPPFFHMGTKVLNVGTAGQFIFFSPLFSPGQVGSLTPIQILKTSGAQLVAILPQATSDGSVTLLGTTVFLNIRFAGLTCHGGGGYQSESGQEP
jgi:hypothetical protein